MHDWVCIFVDARIMGNDQNAGDQSFFCRILIGKNDFLVSDQASGFRKAAGGYGMLVASNKRQMFKA
jgi:hypothetical protein